MENENQEQQVEDTQETEQVDDTVQTEQPQVEDSTDLSAIDPNQLTPEQVTELQQGYMRNSDYTQKTQAMASEKQELATEKDWYKQQAENLSQKPQTQPTQPQQPSVKMIDSYIANSQDAETKMYWQNMKQMVNEAANDIAGVKVKAVEEKMEKLVNAYTHHEGQRAVKEFRKDHPGIKTGSVEEKRAIELMNQGYPTEHAALIAQGERGFKTAENRGRQQAQDKFQQKKQANVESSSGIPNSSLPANKSERDSIGEALDETPYMQ